MGNVVLFLSLSAGAALFSMIAFSVMQRFTNNLFVLRVFSPSIAPMLLVTLAVTIEVTNPDPHGWVLSFLLFAAVLSLPASILTSEMFVRELGKGDTRND